MSTSPDLLATTVGPVFRPGDDEFTEELSGYNRITTHAPRVIVGAQVPADVTTAIRYAAQHGMSVGVQATGHGISVPADGLLITTRRMAGVEVDLAGSTARVQAGVRSGDLLAATTPHGLTALNGSSPDVGVIGYTLGGGIPLLGRRHGYAAERVRSIDVVTADGVLRRASREDEADLFWALLGSRGNFGVVTALETELLPVDTILGGGLWFTGDHIAPALHAYASWTADAPEDMGSSVLLMALPDLPFIPEAIRGRRVAHIRILHCGPEAEGTQLVDQLRAAAPAAMDTVARMPYRDVGTIHNEPSGPVRFASSNTLLRGLDSQATDILLAHAGADATGAYLVELRHLGGALAAPGRRQGVLGRRDGLFTLYTGAALAEDDDPATAAHAQAALHQALQRWGTGGLCPSFLAGPDISPHAYRSGFHDEDFRRLQQIKLRVDPTNMFRINHNIPPHESGRGAAQRLSASTV